MPVEFAWPSPGTKKRCEQYNLAAIRMYLQNKGPEIQKQFPDGEFQYYVRTLDVTVTGYMEKGNIRIENILDKDQTIY